MAIQIRPKAEYQQQPELLHSLGGSRIACDAIMPATAADHCGQCQQRGRRTDPEKAVALSIELRGLADATEADAPVAPEPD